MSKDIPDTKRLVKLGPREWAGASQLARDLKLDDVQLGARMGVTVATALNNARRLGFTMHLTGGDGRKYAYDLSTPKIAHELDKRGVRTGKSLNLIDMGPSPGPAKKGPKLKVVT